MKNPKPSFIKSLLTLLSGNIVAQAIPVILMPILTRIYSPEEFGILALYVAITSILGVIATGRYELAIMLPKEQKEASALFKGSILISLVLSLLLFCFLLVFSDNVAQFLGNSDIQHWLYYIPLSVFLMGCYQAFIYWNNRNNHFSRITLSRISQSSGQVLIQLGLSFLNVAGLIFGQVFGVLSGVITFLLGKNRSKLSKVTIKEVNQVLKRYRRFPFYSVPGALADSTALQMPILILTKYYSAQIVGGFSVAFRALSLPMALLSSALSQVLLNKVVDLHNSNPYQLRPFIVKTFFTLVLLALPTIPIIYFWGEGLFALVFGEQWGIAGHYAKYLIIAVVVRFCVSPLSSVMALDHNLKKGMMWQFLYLVTVTSVLLAFSSQTIELLLLAFVIHEVILYLIYLLIIIFSTQPKALLCQE